MYVDVYTYNTVVWCTFPEVLFAVIDVDALLVLMIFGMESGIVRFGIANIVLSIYIFYTLEIILLFFFFNMVSYLNICFSSPVDKFYVYVYILIILKLT